MDRRDDDYVWHFRLEDAEPVGDDALTEMVSRQISALLRCVTFTSDGVDVKVTGFRFLEDESGEHVIESRLGGPEQAAQ